MKFLYSFAFLFSFGFISCQELHSVYVLDEKKQYAKKNQNYNQRDSLVLYKDFTFRKDYNYLGFCEIDSKILLGNWKLSKKSLLLNIEKRKDSAQIISFKETQVIRKKDLRKYKKSTF